MTLFTWLHRHICRPIFQLWGAMRCLMGHHRLMVLGGFPPSVRHVGCMRCRQTWFMHDDLRTILPADMDLITMHYGDYALYEDRMQRWHRMLNAKETSK